MDRAAEGSDGDCGGENHGNLIVQEHLANDFLNLKQDFERAFHHLFQHRPAESPETFFAVVPPIEPGSIPRTRKFHLTMPIPGMKPEALNITLQGKQLTLSGEQKQGEDKSKKNYLEREFSIQRFARTVTLPDGIDGEKVTAQLNDGILEITAPISEAALPKNIPVGNGAPAKRGGK